MLGLAKNILIGTVSVTILTAILLVLSALLPHCQR